MATQSETSPGKAPDAMRTIGEVATELGVKPHILRYWEAQFETLHPLKRAGGRRYYRPEDMALLREIDRLLNREGFTIKGARQFLKSRNRPRAQLPVDLPPALVHSPKAKELGLPPLMADELRAIRSMLQDALNRS